MTHTLDIPNGTMEREIMNSHEERDTILTLHKIMIIHLKFILIKLKY